MIYEKERKMRMSTVKKATVEVKETAVEKKPVAKAATKKAPVKKAVVENTKTEDVKEEVKKPVAKKTVAKTSAPKKTTVKKAVKPEVKVAIQYADKNYSAEDLAKIANDVWVYDYGKEASELKDVQLYVKPEESKVYYVFNNEIAGDFII